MRRIIILLAVMFAATGCIQDSPEIFILTKAEISLTWKGERQVTYDSGKYQQGFNDKRNEYRIYDDRLSSWFTLRCSQKPVEEGQTFSADVTWTGKRSIRELKGIQFTVKKTDNEGYMWLWNSSDNIGIIIKNII